MTLKEYLLGTEPLSRRIHELLTNSEILADNRWLLGEEMLAYATDEEKLMCKEDVGRLESLIRLRKAKVRHD